MIQGNTKRIWSWSTLGVAALTWAASVTTAEAAPPAHANAGGLAVCRESLGSCETSLGVLEEQIAELTAANEALSAQLDGCNQEKSAIAGELQSCEADLAECEAVNPPPPECPVSADFGSDVVLQAEHAQVSSNYVVGYGDLPGSVSDAPDLFVLEVVQGLGVFVDGITTGTFAIGGDDLQYETCGLCVRVVADCTESCTQFLATGGTVTITEMGDNLAFTVADVTFVEVTIDDAFVSTPVPDGCTTRIDSLSFDEVAE